MMKRITIEGRLTMGDLHFYIINALDDKRFTGRYFKMERDDTGEKHVIEYEVE